MVFPGNNERGLQVFGEAETDAKRDAESRVY